MVMAAVVAMIPAIAMAGELEDAHRQAVAIDAVGSGECGHGSPSQREARFLQAPLTALSSS